jgi:hypothetical protein
MPDRAQAHRYLAFLSYSHADERWAGWLHRALETYRVPHSLVGSEGEHGPLPARLFPIFRESSVKQVWSSTQTYCPASKKRYRSLQFLTGDSSCNPLPSSTVYKVSTAGFEG